MHRDIAHLLERAYTHVHGEHFTYNSKQTTFIDPDDGIGLIEQLELDLPGESLVYGEDDE